VFLFNGKINIHISAIKFDGLDRCGVRAAGRGVAYWMIILLVIS
jgi:hypothetical protein